ncbi:MAG: DUF2096 family protein [Candidatus Bathyarchaeota archaeon]|jgi:hypothetical protein
MSYEEKWIILAALLTELQERGEKIPADVISDLRSANTMIQVLKADPTHTENIARIDTYMRSVESYVIFAAEKLGTETVEKWLKKLEGIKTVKKKEDRTAGSRFSSGVPRDKSWMRIKVSDDTPLEDVKNLVRESKLSCKMQENGYVLVYGDGENIKSFVRRMAEQFRGSGNE